LRGVSDELERERGPLEVVMTQRQDPYRLVPE